MSSSLFLKAEERISENWMPGPGSCIRGHLLKAKKHRSYLSPLEIASSYNFEIQFFLNVFSTKLIMRKKIEREAKWFQAFAHPPHKVRHENRCSFLVAETSRNPTSRTCFFATCLIVYAPRMQSSGCNRCVDNPRYGFHGFVLKSRDQQRA